MEKMIQEVLISEQQLQQRIDELGKILTEEYADKKDKNVEEKKHHGNSVLIVLVAAAIIADICIGLIELNGNLTLSTITTKVASALFLGCICFFVGKFKQK